MHKLYYGGAYFFQGHTRLRDDKNPPDFQKALERKRGPGIYQTLAAVTPNGKVHVSFYPDFAPLERSIWTTTIQST